jgi:hypothetical protein
MVQKYLCRANFILKIDASYSILLFNVQFVRVLNFFYILRNHFDTTIKVQRMGWYAQNIVHDPFNRLE